MSFYVKAGIALQVRPRVLALLLLVQNVLLFGVVVTVSNFLKYYIPQLSNRYLFQIHNLRTCILVSLLYTLLEIETQISFSRGFCFLEHVAGHPNKTLTKLINSLSGVELKRTSAELKCQVFAKLLPSCYIRILAASMDVVLFMCNSMFVL